MISSDKRKPCNVMNSDAWIGPRKRRREHDQEMPSADDVNDEEKPAISKKSSSSDFEGSSGSLNKADESVGEPLLHGPSCSQQMETLKAQEIAAQLKLGLEWYFQNVLFALQRQHQQQFQQSIANEPAIPTASPRLAKNSELLPHSETVTNFPSLPCNEVAANLGGDSQNPAVLVTSIDGFFNRKRGRPPKNRFVEVYKNTQQSPQAIFTSFKLEKQGGLTFTGNNDVSAREVALAAIVDSNQVPVKMQRSQPEQDMSPVPTATPQSRLQQRQSTTTHCERFTAVSDNYRVIPEQILDSSLQQLCTHHMGHRGHSRTRSRSNSTNSNTSSSGVIVSSLVTTTATGSKKSVVRTTGTFFPTAKRMTSPEASSSPKMRCAQTRPNLTSAAEVLQVQAPNRCLGIDPQELPEDLSLKAPSVAKSKLTIAPHLSTNGLRRPIHLPSLSPKDQAFVGTTLSASSPQDAILSSAQAGNPSAVGVNLSLIRALNKTKGDHIPLGYLKFRFNEDCMFGSCVYRNHQSHFHCNRPNCQYSFCDKTRFVQHTARHERLDTLMGSDFQQYRANTDCGHPNCAYLPKSANSSVAAAAGLKKTSAHFHCLKCDFICTDTNRVVAHRRHHNKLDYIYSAGFRKVSSNESCVPSTFGAAEGHKPPQVVDICTYSMKSTHYHCLVCDCSVLSRAQLASHKHRRAAATSNSRAAPLTK